MGSGQRTTDNAGPTFFAYAPVERLSREVRLENVLSATGVVTSGRDLRVGGVLRVISGEAIGEFVRVLDACRGTVRLERRFAMLLRSGEKRVVWARDRKGRVKAMLVKKSKARKGDRLRWKDGRFAPKEPKPLRPGDRLMAIGSVMGEVTIPPKS